MCRGASDSYIPGLLSLGPDFGRSVKPISTWAADYVHQIIIAPTSFPTFLQPCILRTSLICRLWGSCRPYGTGGNSETQAVGSMQFAADFWLNYLWPCFQLITSKLLTCKIKRNSLKRSKTLKCWHIKKIWKMYHNFIKIVKNNSDENSCIVLQTLFNWWSTSNTRPKWIIKNSIKSLDQNLRITFVSNQKSPSNSSRGGSILRGHSITTWTRKGSHVTKGR